MTQREELANTITHGLGLFLSVVGAWILLLAASAHEDPRYLIGASIFSASMVAVYAASTLSHTFTEPRKRKLCRALDQGFIYIFIAGTYTPLALIYLRGGWWWVLMAVMWGIALIGFLSKVVFVRRVDAVSIILYLILGWIPISAARPMMQVIPMPVLAWMLAGGLYYTFGTVFLLLDNRVPYFHGVWHLMVIAGTACHYWAILTVIAWPMTGEPTRPIIEDPSGLYEQSGDSGAILKSEPLPACSSQCPSSPGCQAASLFGREGSRKFVGVTNDVAVCNSAVDNIKCQDV